MQSVLSKLQIHPYQRKVLFEKKYRKPAPEPWHIDAKPGLAHNVCSGTLLNFIYMLLLKQKHMDIGNENDQADRIISTGKLHALLRFHIQPINVVVFHDPDREN